VYLIDDQVGVGGEHVRIIGRQLDEIPRRAVPQPCVRPVFPHTVT
jgi:hypothetical protein